MSPARCPACATAAQADDLLCRNCGQLLRAPAGLRAASYSERFGAWLLDLILFFLTLIIGYVIWWLISLRTGQTPGKQLLHIRAVRTDGTQLGWGMTFVREFLVKGLLLSLIPFLRLLSYLWPLWDRHKQALHDKIVSTLVVENFTTPPAITPATPPVAAAAPHGH